MKNCGLQKLQLYIYIYIDNNNNNISSNGVLQLVVATWTSHISFSWNSKLTVWMRKCVLTFCNVATCFCNVEKWSLHFGLIFILAHIFLLIKMQKWPSKFHSFSFQSSNFQYCQFSPLTFNFCQCRIPLNPSYGLPLISLKRLRFPSSSSSSSSFLKNFGIKRKKEKYV